MTKLRDTINELKLMLNDKPTMTLENYLTETFILPENFEDNEFIEEPSQMSPSQVDTSQIKNEQPIENKISGIEKELTQIRKIALNVITRLADQPSSEQYILMKKIWNTVDKAIENGNEKTENV
mgnify:CR=1 FL=1